MRIAIYDTGIGGLAVLRACLLMAPDAEWFYVADKAFFPAGERPPGEIAQRLAAIATVLIGQDIEILLPSACIAWPHLDVLQRAAPATIDPTAAIGRRLERASAMSGVIVPSSVADSPVMEWLAEASGTTVVSSSSTRLARAVERGLVRDTFVIDVVRETVRPFTDPDVQLIVPLDSHAHLVSDLLRRLSGGLEVIDVPACVASLLRRTIGPQPAPRHEPKVCVLAAASFHAELRFVASTYLQLADVRMSELELPIGGQTEQSIRDVVLVAYAAFDAGRVDAVKALIASDTRDVAGDVDLVAWLDSRRDCKSRHIIDRVLTVGDLARISGVQQLPTGESVPFQHRMRVVNGRIVAFAIDAVSYE